MNKRWIYLIIVLVVSILGLSVYFISQIVNYDIEPLSAVPSQAAVIVQIDNVENLNRIIKRDINYQSEFLNWDVLGKELLYLSAIDSGFLSHRPILDIVKNQPLYISLHAQGANDVKALYVLALANRGQTNDFRDFVKNTFLLSDVSYQSESILSLTDRQSKSTFYLSIQKGLLIASTSQKLIEASIDQLHGSTSLLDDAGFKGVYKTKGSSSHINIYVQFKYLNEFLKPFVSQGFKQTGAQLNEQAEWGELDLTLKPNALLLNGFFKPSLNGLYSFLLKDSKPSSTSIESLLPRDTRAFVWFNFDSGQNFRTRLFNYLSSNKIQNKYELGLSDFKSQKKVDFDSLFFSTIKGELALVHTSFVSPDSIPSGILILPIDSKSNTENAFRKAFEQIDANTLTPFYQYKVDEQVSFSIYKGFPNGILEHLLSPLFTQVPSAYFTYYENNLLFCNSINQLESFIYSNILKSTLVNTKEYTSFKQNFAPNDNLFAFCKGGFVPHYGSVLFDGLFGNLKSEQQDSFNNFYAWGAQLSGMGTMVYTTCFLQYLPNIENEARTIWESKMDTLAITKPTFVTNKQTQEKEVLVQDANYNLYLMGANGRILWKKTLDGAIKGDIVPLAGDSQYLFNTESSIYLLNSYGNNVGSFPLRLPSAATNGLACFSYDKNEALRIFIACEDKQVYLYDIKGNIVTGWQSERTEGFVYLPIQHFRSNNKDYLVFSDQMRSYILDRQGKERVVLKGQFVPNPYSPFFIEGKNTKNDVLVTTTKQGALVKVAFKDGSINETVLPNVQGKHGFTAIPNEVGKLNYLITSSNGLSYYDSAGQLLFSRNFENEIDLAADIYQFSQTDIKIGVTELNNGHIFLINADGTNYKGFPIKGRSRFSIGFLKASSTNFNLIVAGANSYLYNYEVD